MNLNGAPVRSSRIRLIIVDDHSKFHLAVRAVCKYWDDVELIAQSSSGEEAIELCRDYEPDVVLMDYLLTGMTGAESTRRILADNPHIKILALSGFRNEESIREMIDAGASGYLLKQSSIEELVNAIRATRAGFSVYSDCVQQVLFKKQSSDPQHDFGLTPREVEVLGLMITGKTNLEIASRLTVSRSTIKYHVSSIYTKLAVNKRTEAVSLAVKLHLAG